MRNKITKNWGLKLVSFLLAILVWIVVTNINDPIQPLPISDVPVTIRHAELLTERGQVYEVLDNTDVIDRVTIYAPRSVIAVLDKSNVVAIADMEDLTSVDTIPIKLSTNKYNDSLESIRGNIDSVKLNIEDKQTRSIPIRANVVGEVQEGYMLGNVSTEQNLIRISGPESVVSQIARAQAEVNVSGFTSNINTDADIRLYDEDGKEIRSTILERSITKVRVTIEILETKSVPISYAASGTPADGYRMTGEYDSTRNNVVIAGRSSVLQKIDVIEIPTGVLDVSGATDNVTTLVDLKEYLPDGIILAEEDFTGMINITAYIGPEVRRTLAASVQNIHVTGVPDGFTAEIIEPNSYFSIAFFGLAEDFEEINLSGLEVSVDVAAWLAREEIEELESGYYWIPAAVNLPEDSRLTYEELQVHIHLAESN